ncbi:hypothetical protein L2E82_46974 [Cichorium intybus]|uniref:Uncharacterized protein n=1 Tax=Cichorium intybus TaxID=13427 RepID=A0ACB8YUW1_CICIN|nr:hypothetical protein L2E82_46974 [Cichorium intybus]
MVEGPIAENQRTISNCKRGYHYPPTLSRTRTDPKSRITENPSLAPWPRILLSTQPTNQPTNFIRARKILRGIWR